MLLSWNLWQLCQKMCGAMSVLGKRELNSTVLRDKETKSRHTFTIFNPSVQKRFLVDIIPPTHSPRSSMQTDLQSRHTGLKHLPFNLGLRTNFPRVIIIADVTAPIIGADLLAEHNLLVYCAYPSLIDNLMKLSVRGRSSDACIDSLLFELQRYHDFT